jgi:hypothetical protein
MRLRTPRLFLPLALLLALVSGYVWLTGQEAQAADPIDPLATNCESSELPPHTGFQIAPACVETSFGEVSAQNDNPTLLITDAPKNVRPGQDITLQVSIRNIIRDRFLPAGQGGYYLESATLQGGLTRGHAHGACQSVGDAAPAPVRNASFKAVEDGAGGRGADTVTLTLPGIDRAGEVRCAVWAGDGSHRIPMMQFANQIPAFDSVRVEVRGAQAQGRVRGESD